MNCASCGATHQEAYEYCPSCGAPAPQAAPATADDEVPAGTMLGQYRVVGPIARGGMGIVYRAEDKALGRLVAIKVLPTKFHSDAELVERFQREAQAASRLDHPNIVQIYTVSFDKGFHYFVMRLIQGDTLSKLVRGRSIDIGSALHVLTQVCDGLDAIHKAGYVHRDIKSSNIMVDASGRVTLLDFGVLRAAEGTAGLTKTGLVMGTPHYIAPEQARDSKLVDHRSDLYALGVVMYEVFTGRLPFVAPNVIDVVMKHLTEAPTPPDAVNRALPKTLSAIVLKAMAKKKEDRFQSAIELKRALNQAVGALGYSVSTGTWTNLSGIAVPPPGTIPPQTFSSFGTSSGTGSASGFEATITPSQIPTGPTGFFGEAQTLTRTRRRRRKVWMAAAAGLAVAGVVAFLAVNPTGPSSIKSPATVGVPGADPQLAPTPVVAVPQPAAREPAVPPPLRPSVPSAPAPVPTGRLRLTGLPAGATVKIDGKSVDMPEGGVDRAPGQYRVVVARSGFKTFTATVEVKSAGTAELPIKLVGVSRPTTLKIVVTTGGGPNWAHLFVDGTYKGKTPATVNIMPGLRTVKLEKPGYRAIIRQVNVKAGTNTTKVWEFKKE